MTICVNLTIHEVYFICTLHFILILFWLFVQTVIIILSIETVWGASETHILYILYCWSYVQKYKFSCLTFA